MSSGSPQPSAGSTHVLELSLYYVLAAAARVTPTLMRVPTPCRGWDLRTLLLHACDSAAALTEGFDGGQIAMLPEPCPNSSADPAQILQHRAASLLGLCSERFQTRDPRLDEVSIGGWPLAPALLVGVGAIEFAVHGWDIFRACGLCEPIPYELAADLLQVAPLLVTIDSRYPLFAPPVAAAADAGPSARLIAFLGRQDA